MTPRPWTWAPKPFSYRITCRELGLQKIVLPLYPVQEGWEGQGGKQVGAEGSIKMRGLKAGNGEG